MIRSLILGLVLVSTPAWAQRAGVTTAAFYACPFEDDAVITFRLFAERDFKAAVRRANMGRCSWLNEHTKVQVQDLGLNAVCVRPTGEPRCLWMTRARVRY